MRVIRDRFGIERSGIDVETRARLNDIGDDKTDDQREGREEQEIGKSLPGDAAYCRHVLHSGDAGRHRYENNRGNDHFDEIDESIAQGFERGADFGKEVSRKGADQDGREHLRVKALVYRFSLFGFTCGIDRLPGGDHFLSPIQYGFRPLAEDHATPRFGLTSIA